MKKNLLTLLLALFAIATTAQAQVYVPGERVSTIQENTKYFIFNTAYTPGDYSDRWGFVYFDGSVKTYSGAVPESFTTSDANYLFTFTNNGDDTYTLNSVGQDSEVGNTFTLTPWMNAEDKGDAQVRNDDGTFTPNDEISEADKVWTIHNGDAYWNGNNWYGIGTNSFALWSDAHPYAIYTAIEKNQTEGLLLNAANFPDANFRAALAEILKISEGDEITEAKIAATTSLNVASKQIADLTGIEHFTMLTRLNCRNNQLTSLDVSKNTALTSLGCESNQLTSLDVSKNIALTDLFCYDNQLTSLDVSKNTALGQLLCPNNQLTSLDVSKNTTLKYLQCYDNQLTSLDVSKNTMLKELWCMNNQLTSLDLSQNTVLYDFQCYSNQIKGEAMDALVASLPTVSKGDFYVIDTKNENEGNVCTKSQVAVAKGKGWTVYNYNGSWGNKQEYEGSEDAAAGLLLNATNFPDANFRAALASKLGISEGDEITDEMIAATTELYVSQKTIADLTGIEHFTALEVLYCVNNRLTSLDVSKNKGLKDLRCYGNSLSSLDVSQNTALNYLSFSVNRVTSIDVSKNIALETLWCDRNPLTSIDVSKNIALKNLHCYNSRLTSLDVSNNTALTWLRCFGNQIKGEAMDALVASLPTVESGEFIVINTKDANEGNVCTKSQVAIAKGKGWTVYDHNGDYYNRQKYEGSEDAELEALRAELLEYLDVFCLKRLEESKWMLEEKATIEQAPDLYAQCEDLKWRIAKVREDINKASTKEDLMYWRYELEQISAVIAYLRDQINALEIDIDPVDEDDNIDYGSDMDENSDLDGNVIGDIYYNINTGNGGYDAAEGCIVVTKPTDDGTVGDLEGKDIFGEDFKNQFTGIVFKVPAGKGTIKVDAETTGNMLLKVKIGSNEPVEMELNGKLKVTFPYNVSEATYVYIYAGAANEAKGFGKASATDAALKIYGIEFLRDDTPTDIDRPTPDPSLNGGENWYTIDGVKLNGEPTKKGVYIVKGKKVKK